MPITEEQRKARKNHLGSSDIPAILGYSRFASSYDVWLYKTGRIPYDPQEVPTDYQEAGNLLEDGAIKWGENHDYYQSVERDLEIKVGNLPIVVHTDGIEMPTGIPVEAKTEGLYGPILSVWGEVGTTEVPEYTCIQAHTHMLATGSGLCHVPTFLGGRGFGYFYVERDGAIIDIIKQAASTFWNDHVLKDVPPPDSVPRLSLIKKIRRIEGETVEIPKDLVEKWLVLKDFGMANRKAKIEAEARIRALMDGNGLGVPCSVDPETGEKVTFGELTDKMQTRKAHQVKESTFPVLRFKAPKTK